MVRIMYDSVNPAAIPSDAELIAGYIDGHYMWPNSAWDKFPNSIKVQIAVFPTTNNGIVLDCETGDATPAQCPQWVTMRRSAGINPTVYCSYNAWDSVRKAFATAGVAQPNWWIAGYPDPVDSFGNPIIPTGAIAHQWVDSGPYDKSIVADYWPGVDSENEENGMSANPVLFLASGTPELFPFGVWRDEFGVYVGLQSQAEQTNRVNAYAGAMRTIWTEQSTLSELIRISRVGIDTPRPTTP